MAWDRSQGVNPKYRTREHVNGRAALVRQLKRGGYLICTATTCLMPTRTITNSNGRARDGLQYGHADNGVDYAGPQHAACNLTDGSRRGRARQNQTRLDW